MSERTHTPGPWSVYEGDAAMPKDGPRFATKAKVLIYADDDCEHHPIADFSCNHTCRDDDVCEANALLASAAPELLEAMVFVLRSYDLGIKGEEVARAAIAKATGEAL